MDLDKILGICPKSSTPRRIFLWQMTILVVLDQIRGTIATNFVENLAKRTQHTQNFTTLLGPPDCYRFVRISRFPGPRVSLPSSPHVASDLPVGDSSFHSAACTPVSFPPVSFLRPHQCISAPHPISHLQLLPSPPSPLRERQAPPGPCDLQSAPPVAPPVTSPAGADAPALSRYILFPCIWGGTRILLVELVNLLVITSNLLVNRSY